MLILDIFKKREREAAEAKAAEEVSKEQARIAKAMEKAAKEEAARIEAEEQARIFAAHRPAARDVFMARELPTHTLNIKANGDMILIDEETGFAALMKDDEIAKLDAAVDAWQLEERARVMSTFNAIISRSKTTAAKKTKK